MSHCGRPTKSDRPCVALRVHEPYPNAEAWAAPACVAHLTQEERAEWLAVFSRSEKSVRDAAAARPAACWDWPVEPWHRRRARLAAQCEYLEQCERLARSLLADWQEERCAVCGGRRVRLVLDHDHATGLVRGLLCASCNICEGSAALGSALGRYRSRNPASILGLRIRYEHPIYGYVGPQPRGDLPIDEDHPVYVLGRLLA